MGKEEEKMEKLLNLRKCKEEYRKNSKNEYTNECALFLVWKLQNNPSVTTIFIFIFFITIQREI